MADRSELGSGSESSKAAMPLAIDSPFGIAMLVRDFDEESSQTIRGNFRGRHVSAETMERLGIEYKRIACWSTVKN